MGVLMTPEEANLCFWSPRMAGKWDQCSESTPVQSGLMFRQPPLKLCFHSRTKTIRTEAGVYLLDGGHFCYLEEWGLIQVHSGLEARSKHAWTSQEAGSWGDTEPQDAQWTTEVNLVHPSSVPSPVRSELTFACMLLPGSNWLEDNPMRWSSPSTLSEPGFLCWFSIVYDGLVVP